VDKTDKLRKIECNLLVNKTKELDIYAEQQVHGPFFSMKLPEDLLKKNHFYDCQFSLTESNDIDNVSAYNFEDGKLYKDADKYQELLINKISMEEVYKTIKLPSLNLHCRRVAKAQYANHYPDWQWLFNFSCFLN
jgi:hypothetical protein